MGQGSELYNSQIIMITKTVQIVTRQNPRYKSKRFGANVRFKQISYKLFGFIPVFVEYTQLEE